MTGPQKTSLVGLVALALAIAVTDVWFLFDDEPGNTFSSVIQGEDWLAGFLGYVVVHVVRKPGSKALGGSWWLVGGGAVLAGVGSAALGGGIVGMALGGGLGYACWQNSGKT